MTESISRNPIKIKILGQNINKKLDFLNENKEQIKYAFLNPVLARKPKFSENFFRDLFIATEKIIEQMEEYGNKKLKYLRIVNTVATALYFACKKQDCLKSMRFIAGIFDKSQTTISQYKKYYRGFLKW